jgi:hypothetical protein
MTDLKFAVKRLIELRGERLPKKARWKLSKRWLKGLNSASITFQGLSLGHNGFDAVVTTDGFKNIYIGIPGAFRVWLSLDGTYKIDVPNESVKPAE